MRERPRASSDVSEVPVIVTLERSKTKRTTKTSAPTSRRSPAPAAPRAPLGALLRLRVWKLLGFSSAGLGLSSSVSFTTHSSASQLLTGFGCCHFSFLGPFSGVGFERRKEDLACGLGGVWGETVPKRGHCLSPTSLVSFLSWLFYTRRKPSSFKRLFFPFYIITPSRVFPDFA